MDPSGVACTNCGKNMTTDDLRRTACIHCGQVLAHHARAAQQVAVINQMMADRNGNGIPDAFEGLVANASANAYVQVSQNVSFGAQPPYAQPGFAQPPFAQQQQLYAQQPYAQQPYGQASHAAMAHANAMNQVGAGVQKAAIGAAVVGVIVAAVVVVLVAAGIAFALVLR